MTPDEKQCLHTIEVNSATERRIPWCYISLNLSFGNLHSCDFTHPDAGSLCIASQLATCKMRGVPVKGHPVLEELVKLRTLMEKMKPIDQKLQYQVTLKIEVV